MNHFLLPGDDRSFNPRDAERYGVHLMELLVNGLMQLGARRDRLQAKLFGGARVVRGLSDIGRKNGEFAERFLRYEGIAVASQDLGGEQGRRHAILAGFRPRKAELHRRRGGGRRRAIARARPPATATSNCSNASPSATSSPGERLAL